jgi:hypothetical protein
MKISGIARLVPEAKSYLVGSARPTSGPILKVLKERAEDLRNFPWRPTCLENTKAHVTGFNTPSLSSAEHFDIAIVEAATAK